MKNQGTSKIYGRRYGVVRDPNSRCEDSNILVSLKNIPTSHFGHFKNTNYIVNPIIIQNVKLF